jgi:hypothetical protein
MPNEHALAYEVMRLRQRVAELESELTKLRDHRTEVLDIELHRMAEVAEPVLA